MTASCGPGSGQARWHCLRPTSPGRSQAGRRIVILRDLKVVDVNVDRMLVVVVVDELPFFDRAEPRLDQRDVGKRLAVKRVDERLGIGLARVLVEEAAVDDQLPLEVRLDVGNVTNAVKAFSVCPSTNAVATPWPAAVVARPRFGSERRRSRRSSSSPTARRSSCRACQGDRRPVIGVEDARRGDRLGAAADRRHRQNEVALGRHRHRNGVTARRRDKELCAVIVDG